MEMLGNLALGLGIAVSPANLLFCLIGTALGTAVGVLPGLGPTATISLLLPITFHIDGTGAIIMLSGIFYGAMYGGSITAILVKIPGEAASLVTCLDGYEMARKGRGGAALGISAFGSFIAGIAATLAVAVVGPQVSAAALAFGPPERAALVALGLTLVVFVSTGSPLRALISALAGLVLSSVGQELVSGQERFTFGQPWLLDGFHLAIMAMGLFGIAEVLDGANQPGSGGDTLAAPRRLAELLPSRAEWRRSAAPIGRGSLLGFLLGLMPGGGALIASFASYVLEKRLSRAPEGFGRGAIEGVAGPEAANNAAAQASFVPLLNLGLPSNVVMGVIMGALMIHGVTPGPKLLVERPDLYWGVTASMLIGNAMLVVLNVPLIGLFVRLLEVPGSMLRPLIVLFCVVGAFSVNNSLADVGLMCGFGAMGWAMRHTGLDPAPLLIAFVLGQLFETAIHQSIAVGYGSAMVFLYRPIAASILALAALIACGAMLGAGLTRRRD
ncbi:MAG: tripartite tricarboxylate transporter permease [Alphaproteobacteria bacterium]|nr:tripartite tricarboxylate transporter permease [Alphaproteobacteria bacterium]